MVSFIHDRIGSILHAAVSVTPADAFKQLEQPGVEEAVDGLPARTGRNGDGTLGEEMVVPRSRLGRDCWRWRWNWPSTSARSLNQASCAI